MTAPPDLRTIWNTPNISDSPPAARLPTPGTILPPLPPLSPASSSSSPSELSYALNRLSKLEQEFSQYRTSTARQIAGLQSELQSALGMSDTSTATLTWPPASVSSTPLAGTSRPPSLAASAPAFVPAGHPQHTRSSATDESEVQIRALTQQVATLTHAVHALVSTNSTVTQPSLARIPLPAPPHPIHHPPGSVVAAGSDRVSPRASMQYASDALAWDNTPMLDRRRSHQFELQQMPSPSLSAWDAASVPSSSTPNPQGRPVFVSKWDQLGLHPDILRAMQHYGIGPPSKTHLKAIPIMLRSTNVIAQASAIQERIQAYIMPTLQFLLANQINSVHRQLQVIIVTATVDEASQAQRLACALGTSIGVASRILLATNTNSANAMGGDVNAEAQRINQTQAQVVMGTPRRLYDIFSTGNVSLKDVGLLILDEMDQIIARNLTEYVMGLVRMLDAASGSTTCTYQRRSVHGSHVHPYEANSMNFVNGNGPNTLLNKARQTCIFTCTVPQDVLAFAAQLKLKEPVRVLVRRDGGDGSQHPSSVKHLKQYHLYIALPPTTTPLPKTLLFNHSHLTTTTKSSSSSSTTSSHLSSGGGGMKEWKLESFADLMEDLEFEQCIIYCSSVDVVESVSYKLSSRGLDTLALHQDMGQAARHSVMKRFQLQSSSGAMNSVVNSIKSSSNSGNGGGKKALIVYDVLAKSMGGDVHQVPLVINFDLPRAVEDYLHRVACVMTSSSGSSSSVMNRTPSSSSSNNTTNCTSGIVINIVTPGSDVEMIRSIESFYRCKIQELPHNLTHLI